MPISPRSLENLRPQWTPETAPRRTGWPEWRRHLAGVVGDGRDLFDVLASLACGQAIALRDADGKPLLDSETGASILLVPTPAIVLGAIRELLDRAYGRPMQAVVEIAAGATESPTASAGLAPLTEGERSTIREIARRSMLRPETPKETDG